MYLRVYRSFLALFIAIHEFFTGNLMDGERIYYGLASSLSTGAQIDMELTRAAALEYDLIKTYVRMPDVIQKRVTAFAHAHGIPVSSHEIYPATNYGVDMVEHISATSRRGYSPKVSLLNRSYQDVIEIVARSGMTITPTVSLSGGFFTKADQDSTLLQNRQFQALYTDKYRQGLSVMSKQIRKMRPGMMENFTGLQRTVRRLVDAGARVTTGTDSPFVPYGLSLHVELENFVDGGLTPYEALRSATIWSAEAVGVARDLGSVEAGKLADLVIVSGDPLKNIRDARKVVSVFKNGVQYDMEELLQKP